MAHPIGFHKAHEHMTASITELEFEPFPPLGAGPAAADDPYVKMRANLAARAEKAAARKPNGHKVDTTPRGAVVTALSDVALEKLVQVFPGLLWAGKYTLLAGNPGLAKSVISLDIASRLSRGGQVSPFDPQTFAPANTIIVASEDGTSDTIKPRVIAAGGDQGRIRILGGIVEPDGRLVHPDLGRHLADIVAAIRNHQARLLVLDPVTSFFGRIDSNSQTDVRGVIDPFIAQLQETGCALLGIMHLNKQVNQQALFRIGGSVAMVGAPRAVFAFTADEHGEEPEADRLLLPVKLNIGRMRPGYKLRIVDADVDGAVYPRIEWRERTESKADEILNAAAPRRPSARTRAAEIIKEVLADGEEHDSSEVFDALEGFGRNSIYDALRVCAVKRKTNEGSTFYRLKAPVVHEADPFEVPD